MGKGAHGFSLFRYTDAELAVVVRADGENVALLRTDERVRTTRSRVSDHYPGHGNVRQRKVCERRRNVPVRRSIRHAVAELQLPAVVAAPRHNTAKPAVARLWHGIGALHGSDHEQRRTA